MIDFSLPMGGRTDAEMYVDGAWLSGISGAKIEVEDPANESVIATIPEVSAEDALLALETAKQAQPAWTSMGICASKACISTGGDPGSSAAHRKPLPQATVEKPLIPAVTKAQAAGIPTFLVDRSVDPNVAKAGEHYVAFLGSDFIDQGRRVAEWTIENFKGDKGTIVELEGTTGSSPANDRKSGFDDRILQDGRFEIVASQTGDFARDLGRQVMETLLQAHPDVNIVYAHNDEMAIGAIQALELAGRKPGEDVLIVSIDGTRDALQAITDGKMGVTVESSPFFGPLACETMKRYAAGEAIEPWVQVKDRIFTKENAADHIDEAY